ncbi:hypothetical protein FOTG_19251 [Fusarium oxysporum f. sp. vasinfectum 25433]|uniref:Uncharacterized protein n=1 Tax=Fusarium oxysporum f. sp. vasinfectum 25433 TaxID=1089449 RepID=X0KFF8_FUSOX|nr:hypothetical protein FOTG_19251 [Fusarium oxysporum f. sp. vasinfectum 25433]
MHLCTGLITRRRSIWNQKTWMTCMISWKRTFFTG